MNMDTTLNESNPNKCKYCGSNELYLRKREDTIHSSELICSKCNRHLKWIKKQENEGIRTITSKYKIKDIIKFHKFDKPFCFFCLREKYQLGRNETLTRDHIQEIVKENGKDILENLQILCSACHYKKNWARLYMNWHFKKEEKKE